MDKIVRLINYINTLNNLDYTVDSWSDLQNALELPEDTEDDINNKIRIIRKSFVNLKFRDIEHIGETINTTLTNKHISMNTHVLLITESGKLYTWGNNNRGQLGLGHTNDITIPTRVGNYDDWEFVSAGAGYSFGIRDGGKLYAWGINTNGQLGLGNTSITYEPTRVGNYDDWEFISAGVTHSVGIRDGGKLYAWGSHDEGQTGLNRTTGYTSTPTLINAMYFDDSIGDYVYTPQDFVFVEVNGYKSSFAIRANGDLYAWGYNRDGKLGTYSIARPYHIYANMKFKYVSSKSYTTLAITEDGKLYGWGRNANDTIIPNKTSNNLGLTQIGTHDDWEFVFTSEYHSSGVRSDGKLYWWGKVDPNNGYFPFITDNLNIQYEIIAAYDKGTIGVESMTGNLWGSGNHNSIVGFNSSYRTKNNLINIHDTEYPHDIIYDLLLNINADKHHIKNMIEFKGVKVDDSVPFADFDNYIRRIYEDDVDALLNDNSDGIYHYNDITKKIQKITHLNADHINFTDELNVIRINREGLVYKMRIPSTFKGIYLNNANYWIDEKTNYYRTIALNPYGELYFWGRSIDGSITVEHPTPLLFNNGTYNDWEWIDTNHAIRDGGKLYVWGSHDYSTDRVTNIQLDNHNTLTQITEFNDWEWIDDVNNLGMRKNGKAYGWGINIYGVSGVGESIDGYRYDVTPIELDNGENNWNKLSISELNKRVAGISKDGKLYGWGTNWGYLLSEDNNNYTVYKPTQIGIGTDYETGWSDIAIGNFHQMGIRNGELYFWGGAYVTPTLYVTKPQIVLNSGNDWVSVKYMRGLDTFQMVKSDGSVYIFEVEKFGLNIHPYYHETGSNELLLPIQLISKYKELETNLPPKNLSLVSDGQWHGSTDKYNIKYVIETGELSVKYHNSEEWETLNGSWSINDIYIKDNDMLFSIKESNKDYREDWFYEDFNLDDIIYIDNKMDNLYIPDKKLKTHLEYLYNTKIKLRNLVVDLNQGK